MIQDVFIIGATGKVGREVTSQIREKRDADPNLHANPTRIIGAASSKSFIFNSNGLPEETVTRFSAKEIDGKSYSSPEEFIELLRSDGNKHDEVVFVDVTAAKEAMLRFHMEVISKTNYGIVTANKNPLTMCDFKTFQLLTNEFSRYGFRCSVMAGAEAIPLIRDLKDVQDPPMRITGCFSGTLSYIISKLENGWSFSVAVVEAVKEGYTEPNPSNDLDGSDVAKKILILARTAGFDVKQNNIKLEPFIPEELLRRSVEPLPPDKFLRASKISEFLNSLKCLDVPFESKMSEISLRGKVLRYVADLETGGEEPTIKVGLREVEPDSPLGLLRGLQNKITIFTKISVDTPSRKSTIEADGAGIDITARNIRIDLLHRLVNRRSNFKD